MTDRRNLRVVRTKAAILSACREAMQAGIFRPSVVNVAAAAHVSMRSVFEHFDGVEGLWREAVDDVPTRTAILAHILRDSLPPSSDADCRRLVNSAVFGRVM